MIITECLRIIGRYTRAIWVDSYVSVSVSNLDVQAYLRYYYVSTIINEGVLSLTSGIPREIQCSKKG